MDVDSTSSLVSQPIAPEAIKTPEADSGSSALASDFETFLRLLTTQLQNQDPSKPLDSTEFVAQLASFSAVEQQINTNTKLDELISRVNGGITADLSQWIGSKVLSAAAAEFQGEPVEVSYTVPKSATSAQMVVTDSDGNEISREPVDIAAVKHVWNGVGEDNTAFPSESYRFEVEAFENSVSLGSQPAETFSDVREARITDGAVELVFADGSKMLASEVEAVRGG